MTLKEKLTKCKYNWQAENIIDNLTERTIDYYDKCTCGATLAGHTFVYSLTDLTCKTVYQCSDSKYTIKLD